MSRSGSLSLLACLLGLSLAAGCGDACLSLASQICACQPDSNATALCNARAKAQESTFAVSKADQQYCQQRLDSAACNCASQKTNSQRNDCCNRLNTPEGRAACGLDLTSP